MAFDGFVTRALVKELKENIVGNKVYKIYQPHTTDLVLTLRGFGKNTTLLISANPTYPRMYLTTNSYINPLEPPMFCMLLRKHIEGGIIEDINQIDNERIIHLDIKVRDEFGDIEIKRLIVEIMGRHSNIILVNLEKNIIYDGINHVTPAISSYRQILPGKEYVSPPKQNKENPLNVKEEEFIRLINLNEGKIDKQIVNKFTGTSPMIAKEILHLAGLPTRENLWSSFNNVMSKIRRNDYQPVIIKGDKTDFSIIPLAHLKGEIIQYESISFCLENFYDKKAERDIVRQRALDLSKFLLNEKHKNENKIKNLIEDKNIAQTADKYKLYGELLTANIYQIKRGDKGAKVVNYYDENESIIAIPLDKKKSPSENAQYYYKKYNKLKISLQFIDEQLEKTNKEIEYLDSILTQLDSASVEDIEEIREELIEQGYLKNKNKSKRKKNKLPKIDKYLSSEGTTIYVGKNNKQNEFLTQKLANNNDTWLHTKDIPGSHVVIKGKDFGEETLNEAATIAAYFSKAKLSSNVPVDYTLIKYVKKPNGAKPGFVIYENQKTIFITPYEELIDKLQKGGH